MRISDWSSDVCSSDLMVSEVRAAGLGKGAEALVNRLSAATSKLVLTNFTQGYDTLDAVRREMAAQPWAAAINGEYSGAIARMTNDELNASGARASTMSSLSGIITRSEGRKSSLRPYRGVSGGGNGKP